MIRYDRLAQEASTVSPGCDGLLWTPYLMGERTPHLDPDVRAALDRACRQSHGRPHRPRSY